MQLTPGYPVCWQADGNDKPLSYLGHVLQAQVNCVEALLDDMPCLGRAPSIYGIPTVIAPTTTITAGQFAMALEGNVQCTEVLRAHSRFCNYLVMSAAAGRRLTRARNELMKRYPEARGIYEPLWGAAEMCWHRITSYNVCYTKLLRASITW